MKLTIWAIICSFKLVTSSWPSLNVSENQDDICDKNGPVVCNCSEEFNVICRGLNLTHFSDWPLPDDTNAVDFSRNVATQFRKSSSWPISITIINLSRNKIATIQKEAFGHFADLQSLDLSYNALQKVDQDMFANLTNLNNLDLSHNQIHVLASNWISEQNNLIRLNLAFNYLGDEAWTSDTLAALNWLEYLDLTNCSFGILPIDVFHNNTRLRELR